MSKFDSYEELRKELQNLPTTWYPVLIETMVKASYEKKVWVASGASTFIKAVEKKKGYDKS